eukprot:scaffold72376_cov63-Phaeocystis_antarctica.AAC.3
MAACGRPYRAPHPRVPARPRLPGGRPCTTRRTPAPCSAARAPRCAADASAEGRSRYWLGLGLGLGARARARARVKIRLCRRRAPGAGRDEGGGVGCRHLADLEAGGGGAPQLGEIQGRLVGGDATTY